MHEITKLPVWNMSGLICFVMISTAKHYPGWIEQKSSYQDFYN